jgi:hypothetical protein
MTRLHHLLALAAATTILGAAAPGSAYAGAGLTACPRPSVAAELRVRNFLSAGHLAAVRQELGLAGISPERVRGLGGNADAETCGKLQQALRAGEDGHVPQGHATFFEAGGFYFVTISRPSPQPRSGAVMHEGSSQMYVFDRELRLVTRLLA